MKADLTRSTFRPERHYSGVRMQQGRVQLDADWNEQLDIQAHLERTVGTDLIGPCGVPKDGGGFEVGVAADGSDLTLSPGRLYADGILCELEATAIPASGVSADAVTVGTLVVDGAPLTRHQWVELSASGVGPLPARITAVNPATMAVSFAPSLAAADLAALQAATDPVLRRVVSYTTQPYLPHPPDATAGDPTHPPVLAAADGTYLAYLDVWERPVTALEDAGIREVALGGPDTAIRTQTVWQARLHRLGDPSLDVTCDSLPGFDTLVAPSSGRLAARAHPTTTTTDLCTIPPGAGFRRLENQLYRVEVHDAGALGSATFKWSRENGSVTVAWLGIAGERLTVSSLGRDAVLGFAAGDWVELTDDAHELAGTPGTLVKLRQPDGPDLIIDSTTATGSLAFADFPSNPKVRRWDDPAGLRKVEVATTNDGWLLLEDGVEVLFEPGRYDTGDYWLVPARIADGDVDWPRDASGRSLVRPSEGIRHHYCALALLRVAGGAVGAPSDCRERFPALTAVCAEDVCFDNSTCDLVGVETVQQALDRLCDERDLRHHNQHLHGWGIVCGLQVLCGPDDPDGSRRKVTVRAGYAIDADGNDVLVGRDPHDGKLTVPTDLDVMEMIAKLPEPPLNQDHNGEVCLILDPAAKDPDGFRIEAYDPAADKGLQSLLAGTLLLDFYTECIQPVEAFLREELTPPEGEKDPAGPAHKRASLLANLLSQVVNPGTGQTIYLSPAEHEILGNFYVELKKLLESKTFCAMFDSARPFPDYPADMPAGMDTIFGVGHHTRLRVRPGGREAYTVGAGISPFQPSTLINRYDLVGKVLVSRIDPLAGAEVTGGKTGTGAEAVQDVAFSPDGKLIYAIVPARGGQNTLFRVGEITHDGINWRPVVTICGVRLVTLATVPTDPTVVYAIGLGKGLYRIDPSAVDPTGSQVAAFNAYGHLRVAQDGRAFATAAPEGSPLTSYNRILRFRLPDTTTPRELPVPAVGVDDIALATKADGAERETLYTVIGLDGSNDKYVVVFDMESFEQYADAIPVDDSAIHLDVFRPKNGRPMLLITSEDGASLRLARVDATSDQLVRESLLPTQVGPISVAPDVRTQRVYVLNDVSDTVTVVPGALINADYRFPLEHLAMYRRGVLEAFTDLTAGFLQYLKDCLCDHFLVDCPDPTGDEAIYLACVSIRGNEVYKVCNFSKRRYVKSFPTVGYWLSLVPIMPLLDRLLEQFCCLVLPEIFGRYSVSAFEGIMPKMAEPRARVRPVRRGVSTAQAMDLGSVLRGGVRKLRLTGSLAGRGVAASDPLREPPLARPLPDARVIDQPVDAAEATLADRGLLVHREPYHPSLGLDVLGNLGGLLRPARPGDQVTLYEEEGRVRLYGVAPPPPGDLPGQVYRIREELTRKDEELEALRNLVQSLEQKHATLQRSVTALRSQRGKPRG